MGGPSYEVEIGGVLIELVRLFLDGDEQAVKARIESLGRRDAMNLISAMTGAIAAFVEHQAEADGETSDQFLHGLSGWPRLPVVSSRPKRGTLLGSGRTVDGPAVSRPRHLTGVKPDITQ